ncbi:hypothetical protein N0V86_007463 [Didymella sp. IMI 355093]|nr:hypothetical protein N0V86_007463 [Didymella sp. IMI 355093]
MSADLFAEFSTTSTTNQAQQSNAPTKPQPTSTFSFFDDLNSQPQAPASQAQPLALAQGSGLTQSHPSQAIPEDDNDDWGDFEGGSSQVDPAPPPQTDPFAFVSSRQHQPQQQSWSSQPVAQNIAHDPVDFQSKYRPQISQESWTKAPVVKAKKPTDSSVLFDAEEDVDDDDDFGDFEDSQSNAVTPVPSAPRGPLVPAGGSSALVDLLGDLDLSQPATTTSSQRSKKVEGPGSVRKSPVGGFGTATKTRQPKPVPAPAAIAQVADDDWDTFDDWEASIPATSSKKLEAVKSAPTSTSSTSSTPAPILSSAIDEVSPDEQPPTNVPPPGVLLSLFPPFFADAQEKLFKPMAAQTLPMRNKLLAEPGTIAYLQGYLMLASVAAQIIAGRKLRWKRDQILSQGMRIGPASSRATSGMKLTGVDKGENRKEEREVSDVVRAWKDQAGRLRHVMSGVNQIKAGTLGPAPDLQETMPVRTLKQSEGGVPARQQCMMCGLKRDERVTAADMRIEDSFGEWWIEQVNMHRGCRNFWNEHKDRLRQR